MNYVGTHLIHTYEIIQSIYFDVVFFSFLPRRHTCVFIFEVGPVELCIVYALHTGKAINIFPAAKTSILSSIRCRLESVNESKCIFAVAQEVHKIVKCL